MNMISQISFHLYGVENGNDDISSEAYIQSSYLELELSISSKDFNSISRPNPF